jgi:hypothetical protein
MTPEQEAAWQAKSRAFAEQHARRAVEHLESYLAGQATAAAALGAALRECERAVGNLRQRPAALV